MQQNFGPKERKNYYINIFQCPFQATVVQHGHHCDCCRCQRGEKPIIQKNERTNAVLEEMKKIKKFQSKD